ncbi:hypothetical protein AAFF_G00227230 [Aldrovandia affinis]|uniref:Uncharacterized protein n=1 Tax=Aldrovandia affinis TaxID=143900 RepID=A0AAD7TBJ6_9TELE|nr:hypothetical protein AAFF_G00227230 [Aldrovandia affinis]
MPIGMHQMFSWVVKVVPQPPEPPAKLGEVEKCNDPAPKPAPKPAAAAPEKKVKFKDEDKKKDPKATSQKPKEDATTMETG